MAKSKLKLVNVDLVMAACETALRQATLYGTRFKLRETLRALAPYSRDLETEKQQLVDRYAEKDADGKPVLDGDLYRWGEHQAEVDRRWQELTKTEITIAHKLTLADVEQLQASPDLDALELLLL